MKGAAVRVTNACDLSITLPLNLKSTSNLREHWAEKAKRTKAQRATVALLCGKALKEAAHPAASYVVQLIRRGKRKLDDDNLQAAFKAVRDEVAERLGFSDDANPRLAWMYSQEKGEPAVTIVVNSILVEA